ncbi:MAG: DUF4886 domain-containing protein [Lentisphaeria bacterium]|jgi:hypothetical protein|nr:DUF4886 domain-containing protein [Lentisphaeria bacterium]
MKSGKALVALLSLSVLAFGLRCPGQEPDRKVRILGVGNSFTNNATRHLPQIIASDPAIQAEVGVAIIGGCSLERHVTLAKLHEENPEEPKAKIYSYRVDHQLRNPKASLKEILLDGPWDYITIQQVSTGSYREETFYPFAKELYDYIKRYAPDATIVVHETWAHRIDCPRTKQWNLPPAAMYEKLHANYAKIAGELGARVIPVGTAFENAKKHPLWDYQPPADFDSKALVHPNLPDQSKSLHYGYFWRVDKDDKTKKTLGMDGFHAATPGEYLGGLVWYEFFFGKDARNITYRPANLTEEQAASLREVAHQTMTGAE